MTRPGPRLLTVDRGRRVLSLNLNLSLNLYLNLNLNLYLFWSLV